MCVCRSLVWALVLASFTVFSPSHGNAASKRNNKKTVDITPQDQVLSATLPNGKSGACLNRSSGILAGKVKKKKNRFLLASKATKAKVKKLKKKIKADPSKKKRLRKKIKKAKQLQKDHQAACEQLLETGDPPQDPNAPFADPQTVNATENTNNSITLTGSDPNGDTLTFSIVASPQFGTLSGTPPNVIYNPGHHTGQDSFTFIANDGTFDSLPATVQLTVTQLRDEFAGSPDSLQPYRETLTEREVRNLLKKVAFGGTSKLVDIGVQQGLSALVDALMDTTRTDIVDEAAVYERIKHFPFNDNDGGPNQPIENRKWRTRASQDYYLSWLRYGHPLKERMGLIFHDWFATNHSRFDGGRSHRHISDYLDLIRGQALGNFEEIVKAMVWDGSMNMNLDNYLNTAAFPNENFGRELLELHTLGSVKQSTVDDPNNLAGQPTYDEDSVYAATSAASGYKQIPINHPGYFGPYIESTYVFDSSRFDNTNKTIFAASPWEATANFDYNSLVAHILYNHESSGRYVGGKLFTVLAYPLPTDSILNELANDLRSGGYALGPLLRKILMSSAIFSQEAYKVCMSNPVDSIITLLRIADLPMTNQGGFIKEMSYNLGDVGQAVLKPETVFGWEGCGINRDTLINKGEGWMVSQRLLERNHRLFNETLHRLDQYETFDFANLMPSLNATEDELIDHFSRIFDVTFNATQRQYIIEYMNNDMNSNGNLSPKPWDPSDARMVKDKVVGLLSMVFAKPEFAMQ